MSMTSFEATNNFRNALLTTKEILPQYYTDMISQRLYSSGAGSRLKYDTIEQAEMALVKAYWNDITDELDESLKLPECTYLATTDVKGWNGMLDLNDMLDSEMVIFIDPKNTGKLSLAVERNGDEYPQCLPYADRTVAILGPENGHTVIYTFHPGDPLPPSTFDVGIHADGISYHPGMKITVAEAKKLGFRHAKLILV